MENKQLRKVRAGTGTTLRGRAGDAGGAGTQNWSGEQFVNIVKELHAACNSAEASWATQGSGGKERVSFGTNMTTKDESFDGCFVDQRLTMPLTTVGRFWAFKKTLLSAIRHITSKGRAMHVPGKERC
jgi:hypothetical protein